MALSFLYENVFDPYLYTVVSMTKFHISILDCNLDLHGNLSKGQVVADKKDEAWLLAVPFITTWNFVSVLVEYACILVEISS